MGFQGTIQRYLFEPREAPSRKKSCCYSFGSDDLHGSLAPAPRVRPSYALGRGRAYFFVSDGAVGDRKNAYASVTR